MRPPRDPKGLRGGVCRGLTGGRLSGPHRRGRGYHQLFSFMSGKISQMKMAKRTITITVM